MSPRFFLLTLALFIGQTARASGSHPSLPPPVVPECLGVNIHFTDPKPGEMEMLAAAGFKWVRMDLGWGGTEREAGKYDFSAYDRLVAVLDKFKLHAVFILDYGNPLYADPGDQQPFTSRINAPETREAFARWAVAAVSHFKGKGYLWEMWNEPNNEGFWKPKPNATEYAALAKTTGAALRAAGLLGEKGEAFIGPATSTIDLPFIETCFKAGLLDYWDAVSVHPYRQKAPETVEEEYRSLRLLIARYAPKDKIIPVISGEWGYSDAWKNFDPELQGKYLPRQFMTNLANDVALSVWYDWHDDGADPKEPEHHFGIVGHEYHEGRDPVYDPKPAYTAMKTLTEQLGGFRFNKDITVAAFDFGRYTLDNPVLLFNRETASRLAMWRGGQGDERVQISASPGTFSVVNQEGVVRKIEAKIPGGIREIAREDIQYLLPEKPNRLLTLATKWKRLPLAFFVKAPTTVSLRDELVNPFDAAILLPGWKNPDEVDGGSVPSRIPSPLRSQIEIEAEMAGAQKAGEAKVKPRGKIDRTIDLTVERTQDRKRYALRLDMEEQGHFSTFFQHTFMEPINGLEFEALSPGDGCRFFRVKNHGGEALEGTLEYFLNGGDYGQKLGFAPCEFVPGEEEKIVRISVSEKKEGNSLRLMDSKGSSLGSTSLPLVFAGPDLISPGNRLFADGDAAAAADLTMGPQNPESGPCPSETPALRIHYRFGDGWKFLQLAPPISESGPNEPFDEKLHMANRLGMWCYGDGKGCQIRIRFKDASGQVFQPDGPKIDWKGWKFITLPLLPTGDRPLTHWGGANDGAIHNTKLWEAFFLLDNTERKSVEGEVYLSGATLFHYPE